MCERLDSLDHLKVSEEEDFKTIKSFKLAVKKGDLGLVQEIFKNLPVYHFEYEYIDIAAYYGHLHIIKWLETEVTQFFSIFAIKWAFSMGHLDVLTYLSQSPNLFYKSTVDFEFEEKDMPDIENEDETLDDIPMSRQ